MIVVELEFQLKWRRKKNDEERTKALSFGKTAVENDVNWKTARLAGAVVWGDPRY